MKRLPLGIQTFRDIAENDYVYVDKTEYVYSLLNDAKYYFLSRPRRFGKSLLLDTICEVFSGDKEIFKGLYIYDSDMHFENFPVLRFDMSNIANDDPETLKRSLISFLKKRIKEEHLDISDDIPSDIFRNLIEALHSKYKKRVVVLIDEYDKPILDRLDDILAAEANRDVLRGFYGVLKSMDPHLRLTFITGVSKFTKTSVFSGLNNLRDITLTKKYANICGITTEDLTKYFSEHIEHISSLDEFSGNGSIYSEILSWYDGYSWDGKNRVINPFSLLSFFSDERFTGFWYASGTPKFLLELIKKGSAGYSGLNNLEMGEWELDTFNIHKMEVGPLLFQTGYLTIKDILPGQTPAVYLLGIPNFEVSMAFNLHILAEFTESGNQPAAVAYRRIRESLESGDLYIMLETLKSLFASIPYEIHIGKEAYYHSIFYAIMNLFGFQIDAEVSASRGRIDAILEIRDKVYIFEFKYVDCAPDVAAKDKKKLFDKALKEGLKQTSERGYAKKYEGSEKKVFQAAFVFLGRDEIEMRVLNPVI